MTRFEDEVREWIRPVNGQYPRPWMSDTTDPEHAQVFILGRNPATPVPVDLVSGREESLDALFNRNGRTHAELYAKARARLGKGPSPSRTNIERLSALLKQRGATAVLETNVTCYATPMSADLGLSTNVGGKQAGQRIFRGCCDGCDRPSSSLMEAGQPATWRGSSGPPGWSRWASWADDYLRAVGSRAAEHLEAAKRAPAE
ncbi:MAG TPA: hypothetical protein VFN08_06145 [Gemmatimonadales bacterium]|nr:hypothetical protein [Gemmatimonadales bacterium]